MHLAPFGHLGLQEGDEVSEFQPICEVQSDKASIEITSRYSGTVSRVYNNVGDLVKVSRALQSTDLWPTSHS